MNPPDWWHFSQSQQGIRGKNLNCSPNYLICHGNRLCCKFDQFYTSFCQLMWRETLVSVWEETLWKRMENSVLVAMIFGVPPNGLYEGYWLSTQNCFFKQSQPHSVEPRWALELGQKVMLVATVGMWKVTSKFHPLLHSGLAVTTRGPQALKLQQPELRGNSSGLCQLHLCWQVWPMALIYNIWLSSPTPPYRRTCPSLLWGSTNFTHLITSKNSHRHHGESVSRSQYSFWQTGTLLCNHNTTNENQEIAGCGGSRL